MKSSSGISVGCFVISIGTFGRNRERNGQDGGKDGRKKCSGIGKEIPYKSKRGDGGVINLNTAREKIPGRVIDLMH